MHEALKAKLEEAIRMEPSPVRAQVRARESVALAAAAVAALALFFGLGGFRDWGEPRPLILIATTFGGTLAIAGVAVLMAWWRGASMVGPPRALLLVTALAVPLVYFGWKVGWSLQFEGGVDWWPQRVGYRCVGVSIAVGIPILAALLATRRGSVPVHARAAGASLGVASGACAAVLVELWCPVGHPGHVLLGHVLPIVLFGLLGVWPGSRILDLR